MRDTNLALLFDEVRTERLVLRRLRIDDGPAMFVVHGDAATNQYNPFGPDPDLATSEETLHKWLQGWESEGYGYWAITLLDAEDVLGFGGVRRIVWRDREVLNLYYRFIPEAWGHGYASEMAITAVALARKYMPYWPVVARTREKNVAAIRVAERAGLQRRPDLDTEHIVFVAGWMPTDEARTLSK
jgi:[ribosomal protein S5]-alanine N-acetyltransferase